MSLGKSGEEVMAAPPRLISLLEFGSTPPPDMPEQVFSVIRRSYTHARLALVHALAREQPVCLRRVSNQLDSIMTSESDTVVRRTRTSSLFAVDPSRMPAIAARQRFSSVALLPGSPAASKDRIHDENIATPSSPAAPEPAVEHTLNTLQAGPGLCPCALCSPVIVAHSVCLRGIRD